MSGEPQSCTKIKRNHMCNLERIHVPLLITNGCQRSLHLCLYHVIEAPDGCLTMPFGRRTLCKFCKMAYAYVPLACFDTHNCLIFSRCLSGNGPFGR